MLKKRNLSLGVIFIVITSLWFLNSCKNGGDGEAGNDNEKLQTFITKYEEAVIPLSNAYNESSYKASTTGNVDDYKNAVEFQIELTRIYSNKSRFETLKTIKEAELVTDPLLLRQLDLLYNKFVKYQVDEALLQEIITLESEMQRKFSTFRPVVDEKEVSENDIENILSNSTNSEELSKYWAASKEVGKLISEDLIKLIKKRNEIAKQLGYNNYYEMMLITNGEDPKEIDELFAVLDIMTEGPYAELKATIDEALSKKCGIPADELVAYHYQNRFFQEAPQIYEVNFDKYYKEADLVKLTEVFFTNVGLDMTDILANSDLFPKEGKSQLPFTTNIDKSGDVRILANSEQNEYSMNTLLYETGFAASIKYIGNDLPYVLREPSHFIISDAIGNIFHNLSKNPEWIKNTIGITEAEYNRIEEASKKQLRLDKFIFSRWAQVMYHFEKSLYEDPDQDLNALWWRLVAKYQLIKKPDGRNEPDWASKTHIIAHPCTYHNYMLGELLASQICNYIKTNIKKDAENNYFTEAVIGEYLIANFFMEGSTNKWNEITKEATGQKLSPVFFANQFIRIE